MADKKYYEPAYEYKENEYYKLYEEQKLAIKAKYPSEIFYTPTSGRDVVKVGKEYIEKGHRELHNQYLKELADLIFAKDGYYQQFTWDIMAEVDKLEMDRKARGSKYGGSFY